MRPDQKARDHDGKYLAKRMGPTFKHVKGEFIAGDGAYTSVKHCVTPFPARRTPKERAHLAEVMKNFGPDVHARVRRRLGYTPSKAKFNQRFTRLRSRIERLFGRIHNRWRFTWFNKFGEKFNRLAGTFQ